MAYQPCRCFVTLLYPVCINVFCTPLSLSVLLPFILSAPYPFDATFFYHASLLLRSASVLTLESSTMKTTPISSLFLILIVPVLLVHAIFAMPLHAHSTPNSSVTWVLCLIIIVTLQLLWSFSTMRPASLGVLLRFHNLSSSWDSLTSLWKSSSPSLFQLQALMLIQLSITSTNIFIPR